MTDASVRISLTMGEIEINGTEEFVAKYDDHLAELLERLKDVPVEEIVGKWAKNGADSGGDGGGGGEEEDDGGDGDLPEFGELLAQLPKDASGTDQILLAGFYAERQGSEETFATADASKLLVGQGIKLSNPTQSLNNNQSAKRVFKIGKKWKIGKPGLEHLKSLGVTI